jgi:hypothetical protein
MVPSYLMSIRVKKCGRGGSERGLDRSINDRFQRRLHGTRISYSIRCSVLSQETA